jgi:hypothetical protein
VSGLGDLPSFILSDDFLVGCADPISQSKRQIVSQIGIKGCKEFAEFCDSLRCHWCVWFVVAVAISGDEERIAGHPWDVKFILPDIENNFKSIDWPSNHPNKNNIRKRLNSIHPASMRFPRLEHI